MKITNIKQPFDSAQGGRTKKITSIRPQVKRPDRYSIYVDGKFVFGLSESGLLSSGLHPGQELDQKELATLKEGAATDKLWNQVLGLIARRQRSSWEVQQYLKRKQSPTPLIEIILNKLSIKGYVNDEAFAQAWVGNRRLLRPTSRRRLTAELRAKRVPSEIIEKVLAEDSGNEQEILRQLIERKRRRYPDKLKFMQYLARQGFNYDDIKSALNNND